VDAEPETSPSGVPLWSGRLAGGLDPILLAFSRSLPVDRALFPYDVRASIVHVRMLGRQGLLAADESEALVRALQGLEPPTDDAPDEDVHSYLERRLVEQLGPLGRRVHAGRSRNDQVAVATRLWARDACRRLVGRVGELQQALVEAARAAPALVLPGYTHLQRAQPVLLGHYLAAHAWALARDDDRLRQAHAAADVSTLGAGALASSSLPLDPVWTASELGFARAFSNSVDAVSDRDFVCDLLYACTLSFVHLSRLAEDVVIYTSQEFGLAELDDRVAMGSSMMPQKKNPQVAEHLRGRAGIAIGRLTGFLAVVKGLPLAYDSDLQEDKEALFGQVAALDGALEAAALLVRGLRFDAGRAAAAAADGWCVATDVAESLVREGVPFREAHDRVAGRVAAGERFAEPTPEAAVVARSLPGGTSPERVAEQLAALDRRIAGARSFADGAA
jgi:argininosuccinate lyase